MKILVLGGTRFVGRHIVHTLVASGHQVSMVTRGRSPDDLPDSVTRLRGDRDQGDSGIAALGAHTWDVCIDVSGYTPAQVRPAAELLRTRVERYIFISTVSVYEPASSGPVTETAAVFPPASEDVTTVTGANYGPLKVACEGIVTSVFGDRSAVLRPQIVAGPYDPTGRFPYWVQRAMQGGETLAPGDGTDHVQVVDVRDLARFALTVVERELTGPFNMAGHRQTWAEFMRALGVPAPIWVPAAQLREAGVDFSELPLFIEDTAPQSSVMHVSSTRAEAAGFVARPPADTIADTREWLREHPVAPALSPERERALIAAARASGEASVRPPLPRAD